MTSSLRAAPFAALLVTALLAAVPTPGDAQIRASEEGTVAQTVDGTTLALTYSRPAARGRELFGGVVPWNVVWTPGANWATTLELNRPVRLDGVEVPAGTWSVWMTPRPETWTFSLHPEPRLFHFQKPDSAALPIHIPVEPRTGPHTERLTWSFPVVSGDAAELELAWGTTRVALEVVVQPTEPPRIAAEDRARFVGEYTMEIVDGIGWPTSTTFVVVEKGDRLRARFPFPFHEGDQLEFDLVPAGHDRFHAGLYRDDRLFSVETSIAFEFDAATGRALEVRLRGIEGSLFGEGVRAGG